MGQKLGDRPPRLKGKARIESEAREKAGGGVWGEGSLSPGHHRKFLEFQTSNRSIWCI